MRSMFMPNGGMKLYECAICSAMYKVKQSYLDHMYEQHGIGEKGRKTYKCHICGKQIHNKTYFDAHVEKHNYVRKFQCDECGKSYCYKKDLAEHKRYKHSNTTEKPHCPVCNKQFAKPCAVRLHIKTTHSTEPPQRFICAIHNTSYTTKGSLERHLKTHTDEEMAQTTQQNQMEGTASIEMPLD